MTMTRARMLLLAFLLVLPVLIPPLGQTTGSPGGPAPTQPPSAQSFGECLIFLNVNGVIPITNNGSIPRNFCMAPLAYVWYYNINPLPPVDINPYISPAHPEELGNVAMGLMSYLRTPDFCNPNAPGAYPGSAGCTWMYAEFSGAPTTYLHTAVWVSRPPGQYSGPSTVGLSFATYAVCPAGWNAFYTPDATRTQYQWVCSTLGTAATEVPESADMGNTEGDCISCNPVNLVTLEKQDDEVDLKNNSPYPIVWSRHYRGKWKKWFFDYDRKIVFPSDIGGQGERLDRVNLFLRRQDGQTIPFLGVKTNHVWTWTPNLSSASNNALVQATLTSDEELSTLIVKNRLSEVETYNGQGQLVSLEDPRALPLTFAYDEKKRLSRIDDASGRFMVLTYPADDASPDPATTQSLPTGDPRIQDFPDTVSDGVHTLAYVFDANAIDPHGTVVLKEVVKPDGKTVGYNYDEGSRFTGITDENGDRYSVYAYLAAPTPNLPSQDQVASTYHGDHHEEATYANGTVTFPGSGTNTVVAGGLNLNRLAGLDSPCSYCKASLQKSQIGYDAAGDPSSLTGFNGSVETRVYDQVRGIPLSIKEAGGTPQEKTTVFEWDPRFSKPTKLTEPVTTTDGSQLRVTLMTYDDHGNQLTWAQAVSGPSAAGQARSRSWTYNAMGEVLTATDANQHVTSYTYDTRGNLLSVTNALGQVTTLGGYDAAGNIGWMKDANELVTKFTYDDLQRVTKVERGCDADNPPANDDDGYCHWEVTATTYTPFGEVESVTAPNGLRVVYHYDTAHRQTSIDAMDTDGVTLLGKTEVTMTEGSNPSKITFKDAAGAVVQVEKRTYDNLNRFKATIDAANHVFDSTLDKEGNLVSTTDPLNHGNAYQYDALNRLVRTTLPDGPIEQNSWGLGNELMTQMDSGFATTSYFWSGFGDRVKIDSPDAGVSLYAYDGEHNLVSRTDSQGRLMTTAFDAVNRPLVQTAQSGESIVWTYDNCPNGRGHVCSVTDRTGATFFSYDRWGRPASKTQGGLNNQIVYRWYYDFFGEISVRVGPSDFLMYDYDHGRTSAIHIYSSFLMKSVVGEIKHDAWGRLMGWKWDSGREVGYHYDLDGRISDVTAGPLSQSISRDDAWNITGFSQGNSSPSLSFVYDDRDRLVGSSLWGSYWYDDNSNRVRFSGPMGTGTYGYFGNRIAQYDGVSVPLSINGNIGLRPDGTTFTYDEWNRLREAHGVAAVSYYEVNGLGERVSKTVGVGSNATTTRFFYDPEGALIATAEEDGSILDEYTYLEGRPVGIYRNLVLYNVESDHLGAPLRVLDPTGQVVWSWEDREPFGASEPAEGMVDGKPFVFNLRFPGQYADPETGLVQNGYRDYDPVIGRYIEIDPTGLSQGMNPYLYVDANPLDETDPLGLGQFAYRNLDNNISRNISTSFMFNNSSSSLIGVAISPPFIKSERFGEAALYDLNIFPGHEMYIYDDNSNIGYYQDPGKVNRNVRADEMSGAEYYKFGPNYDDSIMRQAVENLDWWWSNKNYSLLFHNCQGYSQELRDEYIRLGGKVN
jgi:RHS repeat-associated protein